MLAPAPDVHSQLASHLEPRLRSADPRDAPQLHRPLDALQLDLAERLAGEVPLHEAPGRIAHRKPVDIGHVLHARGDVRRVALREILLPVARADRRDHDSPRVRPGAYVQNDAVAARAPAVPLGHRGQDVQPAVHRPLRVVLVRARGSRNRSRPRPRGTGLRAPHGARPPPCRPAGTRRAGRAGPRGREPGRAPSIPRDRTSAR